MTPLSLFLQFSAAAPRLGLLRSYKTCLIKPRRLPNPARCPGRPPAAAAAASGCERQSPFPLVWLLNAEITWIFVVATIGAVFVAFGIGANDVANR